MEGVAATVLVSNILGSAVSSWIVYNRGGRGVCAGVGGVGGGGGRSGCRGVQGVQGRDACVQGRKE